MWRRFGDVTFATVVMVAVCLEAIPLAYMTWVLLGRSVGSSSGPSSITIAIGVVATTTMALVTVTAYLLAYQFVSERREAALAERRRHWVERWLEVLFHDAPQPRGPLGRDAAGALLDLREAMRGETADRVARLLARYDVAGALARDAGSRRVATRLEGLEGLSRARDANALPTLLDGFTDPERAVRVASARGAARTVAAIEDPVARDRAANEVVAALERGRLPIGVVEEMLLLAEDAAPSLIGGLLFRPDAPATSLRAALDAIARLQLLAFGEESTRFLDHGDAEVRAAALRAVSKVGLLPPSVHEALLEATRDEVDFVRIHAIAAARLLPRDRARDVLWDGLADRSWWVRRSAADALSELGPAGLGELGRAAAEHPDRFARDIAAQTLRDRAADVVQAVAG